MESLSVPIFERESKEVLVNPKGLTAENQSAVKELALKVFKGAEARFKYALHRCTFFADPGYEILSEAIKDYEMLDTPRIEGCDSNPFDQHYWVACNLKAGKGKKTVIFDPIGGYVGLQKHSRGLSDFYEHYKRKRKVLPNTPAWEGGVRVKTLSI